MTTAIPPLVALTEAQRTQAHARFALLQPFLEDGVPLPRLAQERGVPLRTARRWVACYRRSGMVGLAPQPRADRGHHRVVPPDLQRLIEGLALQQPRRSVAAIARHAARIAAEQRWPPPSYACVYTIVRHLDPALVTLAQEGPKAYREKFDLLYRHEAQCSNDLWQADHTLLDLWLLNERGQPARPWLTVILDDYSRAVAGYALSFHAPSALNTALALRQAIWRKGEPTWRVCGLPGIFYTDHGSDFTSHHLEQVAADLKIRLAFSEKGVPRGRGKIERFFSTVTQLFLCEVPGYGPPGSTPVLPTLSLTAFDERFRAWLVDAYQQRVHSETQQPPLERWEAGSFLPRMPDSVEQLDLLLLTVARSRRVHQDGLHFQGLRYMDLTLAAYVGEDVTLRYDPRDLAEVRVFHHDTFLCRAICQELAGQTVGLKDIIRARRQRQRQVQAQLTERATLVETLLAPTRAEPAMVPAPVAPPERPRLKRYYNE